MRSFTITTAIMAAATLVKAQGFQTMTNMGCYHSSQSMTFNDTWTWQASGYCQKQCVPINKAVLATTGKSDCWCGDTMPPLQFKVDDSKCNANCSGYPQEMCGSEDGTYFSIWNSGIKATVQNFGASAPSALSESVSSSTTSATPSVVTVGGQTHTITAASTPSNTQVQKQSSKPNVAGIAAGVVVGLLAIAAICGGLFIFLRRKHKREMEDEVKRQQAISNFMNAGKPGSSGGMSSTDSRLDPTIMTRRQSDGSIMDNQDYSRRILKVTNA